jgi:hypothetical protein
VKNDGISKLTAGVKAWRATAALLALAAGWALLVFAAVAGDAAFDLASTTRAKAPWVLLVFAILFLGWVAGRSRGINKLSVARFFEGRDPNLGTRLTNSVQLAEAKGESDLQEYFRAEAINLGRKAAEPLRAHSAAAGWLRAAAIVGAIAAVSWCILLVAGRDVLESVWPRFRDPQGDHPPFSRVEFAVFPEGRMFYLDRRWKFARAPRARPWKSFGWSVRRERTRPRR